eukprot:360102-Chlamydomonas_euryale.AAC.11
MRDVATATAGGGACELVAPRAWSWGRQESFGGCMRALGAGVGCLLDACLVLNGFFHTCAQVRAQFGCDSISGAALEDDGDGGSMNSHWEHELFQVGSRAHNAMAVPAC